MIDLELLDEIYAFVHARAVEKIGVRGMDWDERRFAASHLDYVDTIYTDTKERLWKPGALAAGVDLLRHAAMRDRDHPAFDPLWHIERQ